MLVKKNAEDLPPIVKKEARSGARKTATRFGDVTMQRLVSLRSADECRVSEHPSGIGIQKRSAQIKNARRVGTQGGKGVGGAISDREEATSTAGDMEDRASGEKGPARDAMSDPGGAICDREEATSTAGDMEDRASGEKGPARDATSDREDAISDREEATSDREEATSTAGDMEDRAPGEKGPARDATSDREDAICDREEATSDREEATSDREEATSDREEATSTAGDMEDCAPGEKGPAREASAMREDDDGLVGMEGSGSLPQYTGGCEDLGGPLFDREGGPSVAAGGVHSALKRNVREFSPNRWDRVADD
jgi:hypothetical protein